MVTSYLRAGWILICCFTTSHVAAQQFRIQTTVFAENRDRPVSDNLTLFDGGKVYDYLLVANEPTKVTEIAIYDAEHRLFTLLDTTRHLRLELREADLEQMLRNMTSSESFQEELRFLAHPEFHQQFDPGGPTVELRSEHMQYTVRGTICSDESQWAAYFAFIDAYTLLNSTDPRKLPPFARMQLNQVLRARRLIPTQVEMTLDFPAADGVGHTRLQATSTHQWTASLSEADRERIHQAERFVQEYTPTTLGVFRRLTATQSARRN